ncbi:MAG TPA: helix-turn-helix domain-containing protein [Trebonia sp.]|nr:helix-turn-helix domain-containing protein [Trebonia sp.]
MTTRAAQGQATRDHLVTVATRLFGEQGYEGTSIEDVLGAAGVSRGALYHHFAGKEALFEASLQLINGRVTERLLELIADAPTAVAALHEAAVGWISLAGDPVFSRIALLDGPAVLGWEHWRVQSGQALGQMRDMLQAVSDEGRLAAQLVNSFAHILLASLDEIALMIAQAEDREAAMAEGRLAVEELLHRLIAPA